MQLRHKQGRLQDTPRARESGCRCQMLLLSNSSLPCFALCSPPPTLLLLNHPAPLLQFSPLAPQPWTAQSSGALSKISSLPTQIRSSVLPTARPSPTAHQMVLVNSDRSVPLPLSHHFLPFPSLPEGQISETRSKADRGGRALLDQSWSPPPCLPFLRSLASISALRFFLHLSPAAPSSPFLA